MNLFILFFFLILYRPSFYKFRKEIEMAYKKLRNYKKKQQRQHEIKFTLQGIQHLFNGRRML